LTRRNREATTRGDLLEYTILEVKQLKRRFPALSSCDVAICQLPIRNGRADKAPGLRRWTCYGPALSGGLAEQFKSVVKEIQRLLAPPCWRIDFAWVGWNWSSLGFN
jgi:hypothetical protein